MYNWYFDNKNYLHLEIIDILHFLIRNLIYNLVKNWYFVNKDNFYLNLKVIPQ